MKADLPRTVRTMAAALGLAIGDATVERIAEAASFETMKANADALVPNRDHSFWRSEAGFFRRGSTGQWRDLLSQDDVARYERSVAAAGPSDLIRWLHEGGDVHGVTAGAPVS